MKSIVAADRDEHVSGMIALSRNRNTRCFAVSHSRDVPRQRCQRRAKLLARLAESPPSFQVLFRIPRRGFGVLLLARNSNRGQQVLIHLGETLPYLVGFQPV